MRDVIVEETERSPIVPVPQVVVVDPEVEASSMSPRVRCPPRATTATMTRPPPGVNLAASWRRLVDLGVLFLAEGSSGASIFPGAALRIRRLTTLSFPEDLPDVSLRVRRIRVRPWDAEVGAEIPASAGLVLPDVRPVIAEEQIGQ